jgi:hypothetical protein
MRLASPTIILASDELALQIIAGGEGRPDPVLKDNDD